MWMGTNYGLNSYDGSEISNYLAGKDNSLPDNVISDIKEDSGYCFWIATGNGLCRYDAGRQRFSTFRFSNDNSVLNRYYSLTIAGDNIFLACEKGLVSFNKNSKRFRLLNNPSGALSNKINKVYRDRKDRIWLATSMGLWRYDLATAHFRCADSPENDKLFEGFVTDIFEDHSGDIWFGTWNKGLKRLDTNGQVKDYLDLPGSHSNVVTITEQVDEAGRYHIWLSNYPGWLEAEQNRFMAFNIPGTGNEAITTSNRMYCDRDGLLWISTTQGVKIYNPRKQFFHTAVLSNGAPITTQGVTLLPMQKGFLLGAQASSGLLQFNDSMRVIRNLSTITNGDGATLFIQTDTKRNYWVSSTTGILEADPGFRVLHKYTHKPGDNKSLPRNFVNSLLFKKDGSTWIFPWQKGIWQLESQTFKPVVTGKDSLLHDANIAKALEDDEGTIWFADYANGLYKYEPGINKLTNPISARRVSNEYLIGNKLWIATAGELYCIDVKNDKAETYLLPKKYNKYLYDFAPDNAGNIWLAVKGGLLAFNIRSKTFRQFTESDGLYSNNADLSLACLNDGRMIMAGSTYLTWFDPAKILDNKNPSLCSSHV